MADVVQELTEMFLPLFSTDTGLDPLPSVTLVARRRSPSLLVPVRAPGRLPYDHADIIALAVDHIRSHYAGKPDPDRLLGDEFTLRELRLAHEAVAGQSLQRDAFRRTMEPQLVATGTTTTGTRGRPASLFRRREDTQPARRPKR
jgi:8-oxo-dGTP diphosphatase